ncbi:MAG TPA: ATP-binding protein [Beijerinckiaceae bacterium]
MSAIGIALSVAIAACVPLLEAARAYGEQQIGVAAGAGILFGLAAFAATCVLPLRILDRKLRAMAEVMAQHAAADAVRPSDALTTLGREIRRPARSIAGIASQLLATELSAEQRRHVGAIQECSGTLLELTGDIVGSCELAAGRLELEISEFNLVELAERVIEVVEPRARPRDLVLVLTTAAQLPTRVHGDPARLRQVLLSLMGNAIRFTDHGAVVLKVLPCQGSGLIRFEVHDTGAGVPAETRNHLFHELGHGEASVTGRHRGGLGLGICTRLVTAMGGDIGFESQPGAGSVFWVEVPLRPAGATAMASAVAAASGRRAVLLAPGGPGLEAARELLASLGFEVMAADAAPAGDCDIAVIHHTALPQAPFSRRGRHAARPWLVFGFGASRWSGNVEGVIDGALKPSQLAAVLATILDAAEEKTRAAERPPLRKQDEEAKRLPPAGMPQGAERDRSRLNPSRSGLRDVA